jgi:hypothetical protein
LVNPIRYLLGEPLQGFVVATGEAVEIPRGAMVVVHAVAHDNGNDHRLLSRGNETILTGRPVPYSRASE